MRNRGDTKSDNYLITPSQFWRKRSWVKNFNDDTQIDSRSSAVRQSNRQNISSLIHVQDQPLTGQASDTLGMGNWTGIRRLSMFRHERSRSFDPSATNIAKSSLLAHDQNLVAEGTAGSSSNLLLTTDSEKASVVSTEDGGGHQSETKHGHGLFSWFRRSSKTKLAHSLERMESVPTSIDSYTEKSGSLRFFKLAKEVGTGLDIHNPREAKRLARRIFEAFSSNTAALLKSKANHLPIDETLIDLCKYSLANCLSLQDFGIITVVSEWPHVTR